MLFFLKREGLHLFFSRIPIGYDPVMTGTPIYNEDQIIKKGSQEFAAMAIKFNDTQYNGYYSSEHFTYSPMDIHVTCNKAYDENHPAGSSLNDIITIQYYTAQPFLDSNYENVEYGDRIRYVNKVTLAEFNKQNTTLIRYEDMQFRLAKLPSVKDHFQLTFTCTDKATDKSYSAKTHEFLFRPE